MKGNLAPIITSSSIALGSLDTKSGERIKDYEIPK